MNFWIVLVLIASIVSTTKGGGQAQFQLLAFSNPSNRVTGGYCTPLPCSMKFVINVKQPFVTRFTTDQLRGGNVTFTTGVGALSPSRPFANLSNPFHSAIDSAGQLEIGATVYHYGSSRVTVGVYKALLNIIMNTTSQGVLLLNNSWSTLDIAYKVSCSEHYYRDCTVYCSDTAQYRCSGRGERVCSTGWEGVDCDTVVLTICSNTTITGGYISPILPVYEAGNVATVQCTSGAQNTTVVCLDTGQWNNTDPCFYQPECPAVTAPGNGTVSPPALLASPAGTTLTFTCVKGYSLVGAANTTCLYNGTWSDPQPTCQSIRCPLTKVPSAGLAYFRTNIPPKYSPGSWLTQWCYPGYVQNGSALRECLDDGSWSGTDFDCLKTCKDLTLPSNSSITYSNTFNKHPINNSLATLQCSREFILVGTEVMRCVTPAGNWTPTLNVSCVRECFYSSPLIDGYTVPRTWQSDIKTPGYTLAFTCSVGYKLVGNGSMICTERSQWNGTQPVCVASASLHSQLQGMLLSAIIISASAFVLWTMCIGVFLKLDKRMRRGFEARRDRLAAKHIIPCYKRKGSKEKVKLYIPSRRVGAATQDIIVGQYKGQGSRVEFGVNVADEVKCGHMYNNPVYLEDF